MSGFSERGETPMASNGPCRRAHSTNDLVCVSISSSESLVTVYSTRTATFFRCSGGSASSDAPTVAKSSSRICSSSGSGEGGAFCRSATAPTQRVHSLGVLAAKRERMEICKATAANATFFILTSRTIEYCAVLTPRWEPILPEQLGSMFFNPSSGVKRPPGELPQLQDAASAAGLELIRLTRDLDVPSLVRQRMQRGHTLFVAAGGDGTINSVIQALVHSQSVLGVVPVGTYNHFARDLGLPLDWRDALDIAISGATRQVDSARVNERFFVNNVSLGLYPELVAHREEKGRDYPRWKARAHAVIATLQKYPHVSVTMETEHHQEVIRT